jgi:Lipid A 3-O-deacylase (PagL)
VCKTNKEVYGERIRDRAMDVDAPPLSLALSFFFLLVIGYPLYAQSNPVETAHRNWDVGVRMAGATGEENTNSFSEAQILTGSFFVGKELTDEIGNGWRRGRLEYGFDVMPLFRQFQPQPIYGAGFEPVILRWNSSLRGRNVAPYIELAGGGVFTNTNLPAGNTSSFNFTARGGGGIQIFTTRRQFVEIGCQWWHLSNANLGVRNPEFNGIQVSVGYHWLR